MKNNEICPFCELKLDFDEERLSNFQNAFFHPPCLKEIAYWIEHTDRLSTYSLEHQKSYLSELETLKTLYSHSLLQTILDDLINKTKKLIDLKESIYVFEGKEITDVEKRAYWDKYNEDFMKIDYENHLNPCPFKDKWTKCMTDQCVFFYDYPKWDALKCAYLEMVGRPIAYNRHQTSYQCPKCLKIFNISIIKKFIGYRSKRPKIKLHCSKCNKTFIREDRDELYKGVKKVQTPILAKWFYDHFG